MRGGAFGEMTLLLAKHTLVREERARPALPVKSHVIVICGSVSSNNRSRLDRVGQVVPQSRQVFGDFVHGDFDRRVTLWRARSRARRSPSVAPAQSRGVSQFGHQGQISRSPLLPGDAPRSFARPRALSRSSARHCR